MTGADSRHSHEVDALFESYDETAAGVARALRLAILGADERKAEEVKWKSPSYRVGEHFATLNVRPGRAPILVLHRGAKVREDLTRRLPDPYPAGLLDWRTNDRANIELPDGAYVEAHQEALCAIVRTWIGLL